MIQNNTQDNIPSKIKLSVIVPVYNAAKTLKQTLNSLLEQSLKEIEIICVDDGSTDASRRILKAYKRKDPRIKVIFQENLYAGVARNNGIDIAEGEYLHFLDADDYVYKYAYEVLYDKASKNRLDILFCQAVDWDEEQKSFMQKNRDNLLSLRSSDFCQLFGTEEGSPVYQTSVAPWGAIYRKNFIMEKKIRFSNLKCVNDRSFHAAAITNAERIMASRTKTVFHRIGQPGSLIGNRARNFDCHFRSFDIIARRLEADNINLDVQKNILTAECTDMLVWFERFCREDNIPETLKQQIAEQTEDFISSYHGRFAHIIKAKYRNTVVSLSEAQIIKNEAHHEADPFRAACPNPKISIVIPVQTVGDDLTETLYSLSEQTLKDLEFICVNMGIDPCAEAVLNSFASFDERFKIIVKEGAFCGEAVNIGIAAARGTYIYIAEAGVIINEEAFNRLWNIAQKNNPDLILTDYSNFTLKTDGASQETVTALDLARNLYNQTICPEKLPISFFTNESILKNAIIKTEFPHTHGINWNGKTPFVHCDIRFQIRILMEAEKVWLCNIPFFSVMTSRPEMPICKCADASFAAEELSFFEDLYSIEHKNTVKDPLHYVRAKIAIYMLDAISTSVGEKRRQALYILQKAFRKINEPGYLNQTMLTPFQWSLLKEAVSNPDEFDKNIKVSVIMPVYNASAYLTRTLESILAKNSYPIEVICVDDGSTDESLKILKDFEGKDCRMHVITQKNAGAGAARNTGLDLAKGEYLSFLDADDFFEADMLSAAYFTAHSQDTDVMIFGSCRYYEESGCYETAPLLSKQKNLPSKQPFRTDDIKEDLFEAFMGWPWDKLFRREFIEKHKLRFQEIKNTNDVLFVWSAIIRAEKISTMDDILVYRRLHKTSISRNKATSWNCFYMAWSALKDRLIGWGLYERYEQDFINRILSVSLWNLDLLNGQSFLELYNTLKYEWFDALGVSSHDKDYFYDSHQNDYKRYKWMRSNTPEDFLLFQRTDDRQQNNAVIQKNSIKSSAKTAQESEFAQKIRGFITARVDIKNSQAAENDVEIFDLSSSKAHISSPSWFVNEKGIGYVILCESDHLHSTLSLRLHCIKDGQLSVTLRGIDLRDEDGSRIPCWIDYTELTINGNTLLDATTPIWHNKPYRYEQNVKDGEQVTITVSWMPHSIGEK